MDNKEMWQRINDVVDFYKTEMIKYQELYLEEKFKFKKLQEETRLTS